MGLVMGLDGLVMGFRWDMGYGIVGGTLELRERVMDGCGKGRGKGRKRARRQ
jgi:hypothetical protein